MISLTEAVNHVLTIQLGSSKPLAIVLAGHNGSGKSTLWYRRLADQLQIPLINADRMMMSILPEVVAGRTFPPWAREIRDRNESWMRTAQRGVQGFVAEALNNKVPFAFETVFSHWKPLPAGAHESKIDQIKSIQGEGYFVVLLFVGLSDSALSILRVSARVASGGHAVSREKLESRFPRTQAAINAALNVADASILLDNSRGQKQAFTVCRVQLAERQLYDWRSVDVGPPRSIRRWLDRVAPLA